MRKVYALILAGGVGKRVDSNIPKQFIKIAGKMLIEHTIDVFEKNILIDNIILVCNPTFKNLMAEVIENNGYKKISKILDGQKTRKESSFIGVNGLENDNDKVLIHDAVRPFVSDRIINDVIEALDQYDAVDVAVTSTDTIIRVDDQMVVKEIPNRKYIMNSQTPQGFRVSIIKKAHLLARDNNDINITDDCGLIIKYNLADIFVIMGDSKNIKITNKEDFYSAENYLKTNKIYG